ncbi:hypothetical protein ACHAQA_000033 [Verticillium albo-atrum]
MAMTLSECPNRKACDRCHTQKLSCKRYGDEPCERCLRLRTECKSSPSLRYRKQQTAVESLLLDEAAGSAGTGMGAGASAGMLLEGGRSPKRKRTENENLPVPPEFDEMFKLSQQFAEAVKDITSVDGPFQAPDAKGHRGKSLNSKADPGSSMFILSTKLPQLESGDGLRYWKLPDVTVGSFAVESTPSLQMSLTIQLAEEFLSQLRNAAAGLGPGGASGSKTSDGSMFSGVVDVSFQAIKSREDSLGKQLADLRRDMDIILDS